MMKNTSKKSELKFSVPTIVPKALSVEGMPQKFLKTAERILIYNNNFNIQNFTSGNVKFPGMTIKSPPAEEEAADAFNKNHFLINPLSPLEKAQLGGTKANEKTKKMKITDEMIQKFQKMNTILNHYVQKVSFFY
jgi:hypothetical protein